MQTLTSSGDLERCQPSLQRNVEGSHPSINNVHVPASAGSVIMQPASTAMGTDSLSIPASWAGVMAQAAGHQDVVHMDSPFFSAAAAAADDDVAESSSLQQPMDQYHQQQQMLPPELDRLLAAISPAEAATLVTAAVSNGAKLDWLLPLLTGLQQQLSHSQQPPQPPPQQQQQRMPDELPAAHRQQQHHTHQHSAAQLYHEGALDATSSQHAPDGLRTASLSSSQHVLSSFLPDSSSIAMTGPAESTWQVRDPLSVQASGLQHIVKQLEQQQQRSQQQQQQQQQGLLKTNSSNSSRGRKRGLAEAGLSSSSSGKPPPPPAAAAAPSAHGLQGGAASLLPHPSSSSLLLPPSSSAQAARAHLGPELLHLLSAAAAGGAGAGGGGGGGGVVVKDKAAVYLGPDETAGQGSFHSKPPSAAAATGLPRKGASTAQLSMQQGGGPAPRPFLAPPRGGGKPVQTAASATKKPGSNLRFGSGLNNSAHQSAGAARFMWTPELHQLFLTAIEELGGEEAATPAEILTRMAVEGLSRDNVKSHLQRHRQNMREQRLMQQLQQQAGGRQQQTAASGKQAAAGGRQQQGVAQAAGVLAAGSAGRAGQNSPAKGQMGAQGGVTQTHAPAGLQTAAAAAAGAAKPAFKSSERQEPAAAAAAVGLTSFKQETTALLRENGSIPQQQQQHALVANELQQGPLTDSNAWSTAAAQAAEDFLPDATGDVPSEAFAGGPSGPSLTAWLEQQSPQRKRAPKRSLTADMLLPQGSGKKQQLLAAAAEAAEAAAAEATAAANAAAAAAASSPVVSVSGINPSLTGFWQQQQQEQQGLYGSCPDLGTLAAAAAAAAPVDQLPDSSSDIHDHDKSQQHAAATAVLHADVASVFDQNAAPNHMPWATAAAAAAAEALCWDPSRAARQGGEGSSTSPKAWWNSSSAAGTFAALLPDGTPLDQHQQQCPDASGRDWVQWGEATLVTEPSLKFLPQAQRRSRGPRAGTPSSSSRQDARDWSPAAESAGARRAARSSVGKSRMGRPPTRSAPAAAAADKAAADDQEWLCGLELLSEVALDQAQAEDHQQQQQQHMSTAAPRSRAVKRHLHGKAAGAVAADVSAERPLAAAAAAAGGVAQVGLEVSCATGPGGQVHPQPAEPAMGIPVAPPVGDSSGMSALMAALSPALLNMGQGRAGAAAAAAAGSADNTPRKRTPAPHPAQGLPVSFQVFPALPAELPAAALAAAAAAAAGGLSAAGARDPPAGDLPKPASPPTPPALSVQVTLDDSQPPEAAILSPASRLQQATAAAKGMSGPLKSPELLVGDSHTTSLLSAVLAPLDPINRACLAAVLQLLTLQGVIEWHDPPLPGPQGPPAELSALLQAYMVQAAAQHGMTGPLPHAQAKTDDASLPQQQPEGRKLTAAT